MASTIEFSPAAEKELKKLDHQTAKRILKFLYSRVAPLDSPRLIGEALTGPELGSYWKYRVGDWRIIAEIQDQALRIIVVRIGNRREVYRR
jgi:mRNA interferase RelE/StbE